ncbi:uncharacterized protein KY384_006631 [Bacidia gigantensis]|uniref:uncharacterized protein n=1 Tax=Bacidia gigantensis TaxID=2732470 RepID=UPI001D053F1C|nr:uncharacterized protein KY384_006631 [Bacidia gigantensis]KAG8528942.1 hypothetical protein KY384_006631 [Bacidia gigantensis]
MDGDHTAKTFEQGANKAMGQNEMTSGVHETVNQTPAEGEKTTGHGTSIFDKQGAVGKMFNADGALGGTAQKVGGPLDKQGAVGKHFNAEGSIGGMAQDLANKQQDH